MKALINQCDIFDSHVHPETQATNRLHLQLLRCLPLQVFRLFSFDLLNLPAASFMFQNVLQVYIGYENRSRCGSDTQGPVEVFPALPGPHGVATVPLPIDGQNLQIL